MKLGLAVILAIALVLVFTRYTKEGLARDCGVSKAKGHEGESLTAGSHCCPSWTYAQKNHCETFDGCKVHKDGTVYECRIKPKRVGKAMYTCPSGQRVYATSQKRADAWCRRNTHTSPEQQMQQEMDACMKDRHHAYVEPHDGKPGKCISYNGSPLGSGAGGASIAAVQVPSAELACSEKKGTLKGGVCYTWGYCHYNQQEPIYKDGRVTGCKPKQNPLKPLTANACGKGLHLVGTGNNTYCAADIIPGPWMASA